MVKLFSERGATVLEMLVASAISISVLGATAGLAGQVQNRYRFETEMAQARQEARYALGWITRYLRMAGNNPLKLLVTPCPVAGTPFAALRMDPDGDGVNDDVRVQSDISPVNGLIGGTAGACTESGEDVTIAFDPGSSTITMLDPNESAAAVARSDDNIVSLAFSYRDVNRNVTANAAIVAFVEVAVTAGTRVNEPNRGAKGTFTARSEIRLRNQ